MNSFWSFLFFLAVSSVCAADLVAGSPTRDTECKSRNAALNGILEIGCWGYRRCVDGVVITHICPKGEVLSRETMTCVLKGSSHSECDNNRSCANLPDGMYGDKEDLCNSYFRCYGAINIGQFYCPGTLVFNDIDQVCDYRSNVVPPCGTKPTTTPAVV